MRVGGAVSGVAAGRATRSTAGGALLLVGVLALALNLRPAAVSVGPVLDEIRAGLGLSAAEAGVLTSLPVLAFAGFGAAAPWASRRLGPHRLALVCLVALGTGLVGRALVGSGAAFLLVTLLTLGAMAMANVLMPSLVRLHFPDRVGHVTSLYTTVLAVGLTSAFMLTVPVSDALGSWRVGLGGWAVLAVLAALPWLLLQRGAPRDDPRDPSVDADAAIGVRDVLRTRLGWVMAVFFGMQSMLAYAIFGWFATLWRDAGFSASTAGLLVGLVALASVPMSLVAPRAVASSGHPVMVLAGLCVCYPVGFGGMLLAPSAAALWALVVGVGTATFPVVLVLIGLRARTTAGTAALSSSTQSVGYLFSAIGPFGVGVLHDVSGGWTVPLLAMTAVVVPLFVTGAVAIASPPLEDALTERRAGLPSTHHGA